MHKTVNVFAVLALAAVIVLVAVWFLQRRLIYLPTQTLPDIDVVLPGAEEVTFTTEDGLTLAGWLMPASGEPTGLTIVVLPGNGGNRGGRAPLAAALAAQGYGVLLVDYRGYGGNPGSPTEAGLVADARAAVAYLETRSDIDAERIVYFGESLGGGVAIALATERPPAALVLRSPFASLPDVARVHYPFLPTSLLLRDRFPNTERIGAIGVPVLVVAGSADRVVPADQSEQVFTRASEPKEFVLIDGADHNDYTLAAGEPLIAPVVAFLQKNVGSGGG